MQKVRDYMVTNVEFVYAEYTVRETIAMVLKSRHHGFPVVNKDKKLVGFVSVKELLRNINEMDRKISDVIKKGTYTATPEMAIDDAARILFRYGLRDLPVIDENGTLVGIISNLDVLRSHFDRATPSKLQTLKAMLENRYGISVTVDREGVPIDELVPTQWEVFQDELEGRKYEIEKGLAEPLLVIRKPDKLVLVDGHHRALAARSMGLKIFKAIVINFPLKTELGLERIARDKGVHKLEDIKIITDVQHPLVEITTKLLIRERRE
ncbi:MAG: CBS domain-containing protein [Thermoplasmata archaeon]